MQNYKLLIRNLRIMSEAEDKMAEELCLRFPGLNRDTAKTFIQQELKRASNSGIKPPYSGITMSYIVNKAYNKALYVHGIKN